MNTPARKRRALHRAAGASPSRWKRRVLDAGILLATAVVCLFVFSLSTRLGYSRSDDRQPPIILRTQVLNACGRAGLATRTSDRLSATVVGRLRFDVVDIGNFNRTDVRRSFLINYRLTDDQARAIASSLNIGPVDVVEAEPTPRDLGLDLTLVLGSTVVEPATDEPAQP